MPYNSINMPHEGAPQNEQKFSKDIQTALSGLIARGVIDPEHPGVQAFIANAGSGAYAKKEEPKSPAQVAQALSFKLQDAYARGDKSEKDRIVQVLEALDCMIYDERVFIGSSCRRFRLDEQFVVRHTLGPRDANKDGLNSYQDGYFARVLSPMIMARDGTFTIPAVVDVWG